MDANAAKKITLEKNKREEKVDGKLSNNDNIDFKIFTCIIRILGVVPTPKIDYYYYHCFEIHSQQ